MNKRNTVNVTSGLRLPPMNANPSPVIILQQPLPEPEEQEVAQKGLDRLTHVQGIVIDAMGEHLRATVDYQIFNKFRLRSENEVLAFHALEEADFWQRNLCCMRRAFKIHVVDLNMKELFTIKKQPNKSRSLLELLSCCPTTSFAQPDCTIETPGGTLMATVRQRLGLQNYNFDISDKEGNVIYVISGRGCCGLSTLKVKTANTQNEIGEVGTANSSSYVSFPMELENIRKAILIGATFFVNYTLFGQVSKTGCNC